MSKIRLDLSQFKASGIYTIEFDSSESVVLNTQTTRLVVGFSKKGPINAPVFCPDVKTARRIFGDIDKDLENKGSFFHRSLFTCLETGPCFALSLLRLNDDVGSPMADYDTYKSFSLSTTEANGVTASVLYSSFFNKERFYFPDTSYFLANVNENTVNTGKILNFVNLGQVPFSLIVSKTGELTGFNVTARDWFGSGNVPSFVREFDYISDYFINVDIIQGNWTDFNTLSVDPNFSQFFNSSGLIKTKLSQFLNSPYVTRLGSFQGCVIPDLVDSNGVNYSVDTIINAGIATTGLFCALNRNALADYDITDITSPGRVDMIGHSLIAQNTGSVNFLSYNFTSSETKDIPQNSSHTSSNNTYQFDLGPSASTNLPAGLGSTGSSYVASANGYSQNIPSKVAYLESYYGSGNEGKFNNVLCLRKEGFSTLQYTQLANLIPGSSIALEGATGATQYATISSVNEVQVGSNYVLKLGISHPDKAFEGTTVGKNAQVLAVTTGASANMIVGGTGAATDLNVGDWIFAENTGVRYYFRVSAISATGSNSQIYVDTTNSIFSGSTNIANITTFYRAYWESTSGVAGSLFDIIDINSKINSFISVKEPDKFTYTSVVSGQSYYTGYEFSEAYELFKQGILSNGDLVYVSGTYPQPLYLTSSFSQDVDSINTITLKAYRDAELTIGYTGAWGFNTILDNTGATYTGTGILAYSTIGDYETTVGATGFNTSYTTCYVLANDESKIQVNQFLVADPLNTGNSADYILTRVISKKKISSGTFSGYYQINVNQRLANISSYTAIQRFKSVQEVALNYQPTYLSGFKVTTNHIPNGSNSRLAEILGMLDPGVSNLSEGLSSRHIIAFRYIIDTFNGGLDTQSYPKNLVTKLAMKRQKCLAIMNAPSIQQFINSTDPRFTELPTATNPKPVLNTRYISEGGNLSLGPSFTYSLPDEENGAKFSGFFAPFLIIRENNKNFSIPPAADVSNNFIRKFINGQPYSIIAGARRGVLSNPRLTGLEYDFTDNDRGFLEPFGWNPIVFRRGIGFMIFGNQSAYQRTPSAFNNLHVRDLLITVEEAVEDILTNFLYEFNDASTRLQIKSIVDAYLDNVRSGGGIYDFKTIMDESNNTNDIIDQNFAIIDIAIEPARGSQKFINRITVFKTGGITSGGFTVA